VSPRACLYRLRWLPLAALAAGACRGPGTARDEIVLLNEAPLARIDPRYAQTSWETRVSQLVAPGLMGLADRGLGPTPGLAESLVREDDVTYVARLRADVRFSDGTAVTADDVKYTFDSFRDPLLGSTFRKTWDESLAAVEIVDARTVRFRLRRPRAPFPTDVESAGIVARHFVEPLDEAVRAAARAGERPPPLDLTHEIVGAGPYRVRQRSADVVELERNPYAAVQPATARLSVRTIRDDNARVLALVGGSADVILNVVTPQVLETLERDARLEVLTAPSATLTYLGFNLEDPILRDRRVRQAIALALDRDRLVAAKFPGRAKARVAASPLDQGNEFFDSHVRRWTYDREAAKRLLDQAGLRDPDGDGPLPRMTLSWKTSSVRYRVGLAQAMARQLGEVGIAVEVRPFEFALFLDDVKKGNFQLCSLQMTDIVEPDMMRALFHGTRVPSAANGWNGANRFRYRDDEVDRWLDEGAAAGEREQRRALYAQVQEKLAEDLPMLPLWHEDNVLVFRRGLRNLQVLKTGRLEGLMAAVKAPSSAPQAR
jgi:peptide/nickel transport system substrate-binding protein